MQTQHFFQLLLPCLSRAIAFVSKYWAGILVFRHVRQEHIVKCDEVELFQISEYDTEDVIF